MKTAQEYAERAASWKNADVDLRFGLGVIKARAVASFVLITAMYARRTVAALSAYR
jgi:hypothetical protein